MSLFLPNLNENQTVLAWVLAAVLEWIIQFSHFHLSDVASELELVLHTRCRVSLVTNAIGKEKDLSCPSPPDAVAPMWKHVKYCLVYWCVLMEQYPSSSPLGSCSHGRRAGTSGTLPVAHIKSMKAACNSFVICFLCLQRFALHIRLESQH